MGDYEFTYFVRYVHFIHSCFFQFLISTYKIRSLIICCYILLYIYIYISADRLFEAKSKNLSESTMKFIKKKKKKRLKGLSYDHGISKPFCSRLKMSPKHAPKKLPRRSKSSRVFIRLTGGTMRRDFVIESEKAARIYTHTNTSTATAEGGHREKGDIPMVDDTSSDETWQNSDIAALSRQTIRIY